ncbi:---NA--- [Podarcis lilfordi]|uniref:---NA n=1 Tax=Podarcis lilfordi TaxID=74358 RepID=A0AA35K3L3_9SAUR|nr:---NA--- [Podarcis lilfordi]
MNNHVRQVKFAMALWTIILPLLLILSLSDGFPDDERIKECGAHYAELVKNLCQGGVSGSIGEECCTTDCSYKEIKERYCP